MITAATDRFCAFLRERAGMPSVLWFFAVIFLLSEVSILVMVAPVGMDLFLALQTTLSPDTFAALVADLYRRGAVESYLGHFYYDFLHPVWYATLLALLLARAMNRLALPAAGNRWLLLPFLAGLLDLVENSLHIYMVVDTANIAPPLVLLANGSALAKWALIGVCSVAVLVLFARRRHNG
ncbi:MAG: hypothetical protein ACOY3X_03535 [Pseudomonadota bacterium]